MKLLKTLGALWLALIVAGTDALARDINYLGFCNNGRQDFVSTEAAPSQKPGFFHEEFGFGDEGRYTLVVHSNGQFRFDGFAYIRDDARDQWVFHSQKKNTDTFAPKVRAGEWGKLLLVQAVKQGGDCPGCSLYMTLTSKGCKPSSGGGSLPQTQQNLPPGSLCSIDSECASGSCLFSICL